MSRQFIVRPIDNEYLVIDITGIGVSPRFRPTTRFASWTKTERYLVSLGATKTELDAVWSSFEAIGKAILTIESAEDEKTSTAP